MNILISNDDGIYAQGIRILAKALQTIADVTVVAPDRNRSGASNSLTLANPLRVKQIEPNFYSVEGTPTDCVHLALTGLMDKQPDMVVSGINAGSNLGDDVLYSGTVAAAIEGRFLGLPSIAVSLTSLECRHFETAAMIAKELVLRLQTDPLPGQTILNVNVPDIPISDVKGIAVTRLGARHKAESVLKTTDPRGEPIYWFGPPGAEADAGSGTDFYAINNRYVSITPLSVDLTHYKVFDQLAGWMNGIDL